MPEAGYGTNGHLMVIVGFTADGDLIINDPADNSNAAVRTVYTRENFESVWQRSTGGMSYVYHPKDVKLPATCRGSPRTGRRAAKRGKRFCDSQRTFRPPTASESVERS